MGHLMLCCLCTTRRTNAWRFTTPTGVIRCTFGLRNLGEPFTITLSEIKNTTETNLLCVKYGVLLTGSNMKTKAAGGGRSLLAWSEWPVSIVDT